MMKKIIISILLFLLLGGFILWQGTYLPADTDSADEKIFSIKRGQGLFQIAENLEKEGLIKSSFYFKIYALLKGYAASLQAGEYLLNPSMSVPEIIQKLIKGDVAKITVTIPEGFTVKQIEKKLGLILPGENLEGFLFPDTYQFPANVSGGEVVAKMRENFERKLTVDLREEIEKQGKTIFEIVTMASLIEKEVKTLEEKKLVSGIFWKRIKKGMTLDSCATIAYLLGKENWTFEEMRKEIAQGKEIESPYNTYKYAGLPPAPICNPGLESIIAAIYPEDSPYWYYLSTPEGKTIFSKTLEEHNIAKAKYFN